MLIGREGCRFWASAGSLPHREILAGFSSERYWCRVAGVTIRHATVGWRGKWQAALLLPAILVVGRAAALARDLETRELSPAPRAPPVELANLSMRKASARSAAKAQGENSLTAP